ncbi:hypothetical protein [Streptomyces sp. NPDC090445]|uniref:hypothetical protein n=1 Tax=Streptomyces sp. NPDC090445 TaxID=3365963 RepID=UPI0038164C18
MNATGDERIDVVPLGRLDYPGPVGEEVTVLGDGTWLTHDGDRLHRWSLGHGRQQCPRRA